VQVVTLIHDLPRQLEHCSVFFLPVDRNLSSITSVEGSVAASVSAGHFSHKSLTLEQCLLSFQTHSLHVLVNSSRKNWEFYIHLKDKRNEGGREEEEEEEERTFPLNEFEDEKSPVYRPPTADVL